MRVVPLSEAVAVNPKIDRTLLADDTAVSFVPMAAVGAADGNMDASTVRPYVEVKKGYTHFRENDVLFAKVTPCMENGKMAVARKLKNGMGFGSTEFHVLRPREGVDPHFVYYYVSSQTFRKEAARHMTGAVGLRRVPSAFLESAEIPLPALEKQREIVAELEKQFSRLDEAVANLQRVKANLKRYKASVLKAAVEGCLVETEATLARREGRSYETGEQLLERILDERRVKWNGKGKYKEPVAPTGEFTIAVPEGWTSATVDQLGSVQLGKMLDKQKHTAGAPYRYLRNINVRWGTFDVSDVFEMNFEADELERFSVRAGDVLVCEGGEPARAAVWRSTQTDMKYQKALHRVRFDGAYLPDLLVIVLEHLAKSGALDELYGGSTIKHFTRETFVKLVLPVPPAAEQARVVAEVDRHLSIIREVEAEVDANLRRAQALRQAILQKMFGVH